MTHSSDLTTKLKKVRGLGSAHHGVEHWWWQRVTAVALVPLTAWFMISLTGALLAEDVAAVSGWFASPLNTVLMLLLVPMALFHAKLGLQVVIEDYVHAPAAKYFLLLANIFACFGMAVLCVLAVLKLHVG